MNIQSFSNALAGAVPVGTILQNPGGGTSKVISISNGKIRYVRGSSTMAVPLQSLFDAYSTFRGRTLSSSELKRFAPAIFDSAARPAGHSCNATFLFLALREMGIVSSIQGRGVAGNPFFVAIPP